MFVFTSCVFAFYADHSPPPVLQRRVTQFNVKYGQKFHFPMCWYYVEHSNSVMKHKHVGRGDKLLSVIDFKLSQRRPFGTCASYRSTKYHVLWMIIKLTRCSAGFGSSMPRLILWTVKCLFSREVWDANNYLNWFIVHVLRCLNKFQWMKWNKHHNNRWNTAVSWILWHFVPKSLNKTDAYIYWDLYRVPAARHVCIYSWWK